MLPLCGQAETAKMEPIGYIPPAEFEEMHYRSKEAQKPSQAEPA